MNEYEINRDTLAIIPISEYKSMVYEVNKDFIVNLSTLKIIDDSCKFFGSSYEGRFEGTKQLLNISHKSPILIEETNKVIFFPTTSPRLNDCAWVSLNNLKDYCKSKTGTLIKFYCGKEMFINIDFGIIDNQVLRATRLESVVQKRIKEYF